MISARSNFLASDMHVHLDRLRRYHLDLYDCIDLERLGNGRTTSS
jgi:hypothetical protein